MKRKKINKAITTMKKACKKSNCDTCLLQSDYGTCLLGSRIPEDWRKVK